MKLTGNELRICNWVQKSGSKTPYMITLETFWRHYVTADAFYYLEPITITPEILEKAGFVLTGRYAIGAGGYNTYDNDSLQLMQPVKYGPFSIAFYPAKISYLHQLQNIYFALTGQELTINL